MITLIILTFLQIFSLESLEYSQSQFDNTTQTSSSPTTYSNEPNNFTDFYNQFMRYAKNSLTDADSHLFSKYRSWPKMKNELLQKLNSQEFKRFLQELDWDIIREQFALTVAKVISSNSNNLEDWPTFSEDVLDAFLAIPPEKITKDDFIRTLRGSLKSFYKKRHHPSNQTNNQLNTTTFTTTNKKASYNSNDDSNIINDPKFNSYWIRIIDALKGVCSSSEQFKTNYYFEIIDSAITDEQTRNNLEKSHPIISHAIQLKETVQKRGRKFIKETIPSCYNSTITFLKNPHHKQKEDNYSIYISNKTN